MRLIALLLTCTLAFGASSGKPASAPVANPSAGAHTLAEFSLGPAVIGAVDLAKAKGKGVVIEAWGVHCPPCIASLPHMQELSVKHKDKVIFVGAEAQGSDKKAIEAVITKAGVTYPIVSGLAKCPINFSGIPHAFVFDGTGKMIFDGHPMDAAFEAAVRKVAGNAKK